MSPLMQFWLIFDTYYAMTRIMHEIYTIYNELLKPFSLLRNLQYLNDI